VRVRTHVDRLRDAGRERDGSDVIEEDERPHHVAARERQHTADFESAEVATALGDDFHARILGSDPVC